MFVRVARVAGWNAALLLAGLALIAIAAEGWLRLTTPSFTRSVPVRFIPGVGMLYEPHAEVRHTNNLDFWTIQRANSLGFLDREPPDPARAAASCHVAVIGDSYVAAQEVTIADKLQVRLEALAAREAPQLDVTASAYGYFGNSQIDQLPWYDEYVRPLRPNLVALVFAENDFAGNRALLRRLREGWTPALALVREADGGGWYEGAARRLTERSLFARWLDAKRRAFGVGVNEDDTSITRQQATLVARGPGFGWILDGWEPPQGLVDERLLPGGAPPDWRTLADEEVSVWSREIATLALAGFKGRADRDGAALVVLATHHLDSGADHYGRQPELLRSKAAILGIPVIVQHDWIVRSGGRVEDAHWRHDHHWSPQGHQWAAEAILDWLRRHPDVCED